MPAKELIIVAGANGVGKTTFALEYSSRLYRPLVDRWLLVYNSGNRPLDVAAGSAENISVKDAELYTIFSRWIEGNHDG